LADRKQSWEKVAARSETKSEASRRAKGGVVAFGGRGVELAEVRKQR
jgi:hypothetical protein